MHINSKNIQPIIDLLQKLCIHSIDNVSKGNNSVSFFENVTPLTKRAIGFSILALSHLKEEEKAKSILAKTGKNSGFEFHTKLILDDEPYKLSKDGAYCAEKAFSAFLGMNLCAALKSTSDETKINSAEIIIENVQKKLAYAENTVRAAISDNYCDDANIINYSPDIDEKHYVVNFDFLKKKLQQGGFSENLAEWENGTVKELNYTTGKVNHVKVSLTNLENQRINPQIELAKPAYKFGDGTKWAIKKLSNAGNKAAEAVFWTAATPFIARSL